MLIAAIISVDPFGDRLRPGTGAAFVVLVAFLVSFLAIRTSARVDAERVVVHDVYWTQEGRASLDAPHSAREV